MRIASVMMVAMIACSNADPAAPAVSPSPSPSAAPTPAPPPAVIADAAAIEVDAAVATEIRAKPPAQVDKEAARIRADIRNSAAFAELLVAEGPGTSVDLSRRRPDADLDSRSKNAGRLGGHGGGGRAATGMLGSGTGPKPDDTAPTAPTGRVAVVHNLASDDTSLTDATVLQKIQSAYMAGIKRCYERVLATNPTASGTVDFAFEVDDLGRTIGGKATGFDEAIDTCLEAMTSRWRFPIPKTPDGTATTARFSFRFKLMPA